MYYNFRGCREISASPLILVVDHFTVSEGNETLNGASGANHVTVLRCRVTVLLNIITELLQQFERTDSYIDLCFLPITVNQHWSFHYNLQREDMTSEQLPGYSWWSKAMVMGYYMKRYHIKKWITAYMKLYRESILHVL